MHAFADQYQQHIHGGNESACAKSWPWIFNPCLKGSRSIHIRQGRTWDMFALKGFWIEAVLCPTSLWSSLHQTDGKQNPCYSFGIFFFLRPWLLHRTTVLLLNVVLPPSSCCLALCGEKYVCGHGELAEITCLAKEQFVFLSFVWLVASSSLSASLS